MDNLFNIELAPKDYWDRVDHLVDQTKTIRANAHGAAQEFDTMDPDLRTYVNPTFLKGGGQNVQGSGSEAWANAVKPPQSEIDGAKAAVARGVPRSVVDARVRAHGYRPMGY
jgi:conjugal transfer/entry exclusion protein